MRLRGLGMGSGTAMGTAIPVIRRGATTLPPPLPKRLTDAIARRRLDEKPDIILVAEDYTSAVVLADVLPWGNVVGIAAEHAAPDAPLSSLPAVVNVPQLMSNVETDVLLIVDADRGLVVVDPEPDSLARYQAESTHLVSRQRLHLDAAHLSATTVDGQTIRVVARVQTLEDIAHAL